MSYSGDEETGVPLTETKMLLTNVRLWFQRNLGYFWSEALRFLYVPAWHRSRNMVLLAGLFTGLVALICWAVAAVDPGGFNGC